MTDNSFIVTISDEKAKYKGRSICIENQCVIPQTRTLEDLESKLKEKFSNDIDIKYYCYLDDDGEEIRIDSEDDYNAMIDYFKQRNIHFICLFVVLNNYDAIKEVSKKLVESGIERKEKEKEIQIEQAITELLTKNFTNMKKDFIQMIKKQNPRPDILYNYQCFECKSMIKGRLYHCPIQECKDYYLCDDCLATTTHPHNLEVILNKSK